MVAWLLAQPGHGGGALDQSGGGRDQRRLRAQRHPPPPGRASSTCARRWRAPRGGPVAEGSVGAGTGTVAFGWKGGIGTSSRRRRRRRDSGWTVGVLVQSNFGGDLHILGAPVGRALGRDGLARERASRQGARRVHHDRGRDRRAAVRPQPPPPRRARASSGVGRTGSAMDNGSGDYVIAFSTHPGVRRRRERAASQRRGAGQRRDVGAVPGGGRGDRGGDLQLAASRRPPSGPTGTPSRRCRPTRCSGFSGRAAR